MVVPSGGAGAVEGGVGGGVSAVGSGSGRVKGSWTPEEDDLLRRAVTRHGPRNWTVISAEIPGRSGKSCRLRWCNQLSPGVERRAFTPEEDAVIVAAHAQYGNKWATIARMLHGRTDNSVKNHWNSTLRRQRRAAAANANASAVGCALQLRPLAAAAATAAPVPLRHLLDLKESAAAAASVPFHRLDPKEVDEDMDEEDDEDGSSEDSVLMPPPKKRPCAGHQHPSSLAVKPEHAKPPPPLPAPAPAEPLTSLTLSLPGGGGNGVGVHDETPAQQTQSAAASVEGAVNMRAKLEQDPWFVPVMRQMICEEVQRQMQGMDVSCSSLVAVPAGRSSAGGGADGGGANGQD
ncbi:unnamed protein product [Miscanthus lutarioriparius]|uniref:Uncharacterized protein n=1 Tax=Miscanthus lutarioriparius TaxID=422564 RepID=A0A811S005_9POAL|nr:unnamed protein product [Miscanthus lutarioriparius]